MLSRIAESLYWIGRYVERAEDTSRMVDVHLALLLDDPWASEDVVCASLLMAMGREVAGDVTPAEVLDTLVWDRGSPASVVGALGAARENARRSREVVSTELWECLNTTAARMPRRVTSDKVHEFFTWVRERTALAVGVMESGASRDEAWNFFTLGRSLERADMTARLLATSALTEASGPSWTTILRSCGAYEAYLRTYRGVPSARNAAEFLLHDRLFPAHVGFNLLGWVGLTVVGTFILLWPTVLGTRASETAKGTARSALILLCGGVVLYGLFCLADLRPGIVAAVVVYVAGIVLVLVDAVRQARRSPPSSFAAWSLAAAMVHLPIAERRAASAPAAA